jgi:hypothetical protein
MGLEVRFFWKNRTSGAELAKWRSVPYAGLKNPTVTCTVTYAFTGSLLLMTLIHWLVVWVWLVGLGGWRGSSRCDAADVVGG